MDSLDLLKKDWNGEQNFPKVEESDIYKMIHKRSSSIVKWIFLISILEIVFWLILNLTMSDQGQEKLLESYHLKEFMKIGNIIHWTVWVVFIVVFYLNFRKISNVSSALKLMKSIIRTRKIVTIYVWYNLIATMLIMIVVWIFMFRYDVRFVTLEDSSQHTAVFIGIIVGMFIVMVMMFALLWLFYRLIYGILLKRLHKNYEELSKMEL